MSEFQEHLRECLQDPEFAAAYEELRPEYEAIRAMIGAEMKRDKLREPESRDKSGKGELKWDFSNGGGKRSDLYI